MSVPKAIEAVKEISTSLVVLPGTEQYDNIIKSYYTELERNLKPAAFLTPSSTSQVAAIVKAVQPILDSPSLAICGAGQQTTPGAANVHEGITLHLRKIRGIEINTEKKILSVGAGEIIADVYEKAAAAGLCIAGNRHATGGIGGEALQGGLSYWSYAKGFACDTVVNYEVVLASGEVVNANATTNKDLWIALKGGGNNFGVVTRFDFETFPQGQLWGGKVFYFLPSFSGQVQSLVDYLHAPNPDLDIHICLSLGYAAMIGDIVCMNDIFSTKSEKPKALEPFADVQPQIDQMKTLRAGSAKELTTVEFSGAAPNRVVKMSTTVKADAGILNYAVQVYQEAFKELKDVGNLLFSLTFEPIPISLIEASENRGGNSLGLKPLDGPLVVVLFYTSWDDASDDDKIISVNKTALEKLEAGAEKKGVASPYRWLHYGYPHQDIMASYGSESLEHLRTVSRKYDPEGFFQKAGTGLFKLWK